MKIKEFLTESSTDLVARFYKQASREVDEQYNPEAVQISDMNKEYYKEFFHDWFTEGLAPVFTKPVTKPQPAYRPEPQPGQRQSPGYRGQQYAKCAAGMPYNHKVQNYDPNLGPAGIDNTLQS